MPPSTSNSKQNAKHLYEGEHGQSYHETKRQIPEEAFFWVARSRAKKMQRHIDCQDTVIEYGVGYGWNLAEVNCLRRIGFDIADFLETAVDSHGIEFLTSTEELPDEIADVLICHHVLEHLSDPFASLIEMHRLLRSGGKMLIFVPYEWSTRFTSSDRDHHFYSWDVQTLGNLVVECGFRFERGGIGTFGYDRFAAHLAAGFRIGEFGYRMARGMLHLVRPRKEVRIIAIKP